MPARTVSSAPATSPSSRARTPIRKPGKTLLWTTPASSGKQRAVFVVDELESVDALVQGAPDQVFAHPVAPIDIALVVQIVGSAAGRDLHDQLGRPFNVVVVTDARLATGLRPDEEGGVRLEFVVEVQSHRGVVQRQNAGGERGVGAKEAMDGGLRASMTGGAGGRCHVDDSLDQLCFLDVRPGGVAAFELATREAVAALQARRRQGLRSRALGRQRKSRSLRSRFHSLKCVGPIVPQPAHDVLIALNRSTA